MAASSRRVSVLMARLAGRASRSHGSATAARRPRPAGWPGPEPGGGELVRGRLAGIDPVEVAAEGEGQAQPGRVEPGRVEPGRVEPGRVDRGRVKRGRGQAVGRAVLEGGRGAEVGDRLGVGEVTGAVGTFGEQRCSGGGGGVTDGGRAPRGAR